MGTLGVVNCWREIEWSGVDERREKGRLEP